MVEQSSLALNPSDAVKIMRKISDDLEDGICSYQFVFGTIYSRIPGEKNTPLFNFDCFVCSTCKTIDDGTVDSIYSYKSFKKEVLLYSDIKTGELIHIWNNPYTGKECNVMHIANDPLIWTLPGFMHSKEKPFQLPGRIVGNHLIMTCTVPLFYPNPLGGEYQSNIGGFYHSTEMFDDFVKLDEAVDPSTTSIKDVGSSWTRLCPWLPWMEMGGRPGNLLYHGAGKRLSSFEELPKLIQDVIDKKYPDYKVPPPLDDERPNESSWIYYKKVKTGERKYPWDN